MPHSTALIPCLRYCDAGAAFVIDFHDKDHGGRGITCRDIDGHISSVGTYAPAP